MKGRLPCLSTVPTWNQIENMIEGIPGWSSVDQLHTIFTLLVASSDLEGDIIEVGSWCGRSAIALGLAVQLCGRGKVHCVDLFPELDDWKQNRDGSYSFEVIIQGKKYSGYEDQTVWQDVFDSQIKPVYEKYGSIYHCLIQVLQRHGMNEWVHVFRGGVKSFMNYQNRDFKCRAAFLDGDHGYDSVCDDIRNIEPHLVSGGWLFFDDAFSCYDGVNKAIRELILEGGRYDFGCQMTRKLFIARKK